MGQNTGMRRAVYFAALMALMAVGCQPTLQHVKVTRPEKFYKSVVSLSPGTTEIVSSLSSPNLLKGKTAADNYPLTVPKAGEIPIVATVKPDYEAITRVHPDLIVYDSSLYGPADVAKIKGLGFETYAIDADTVKEFINQLYVVGDKLGYGSQFQDYILRIEDESNKAKGDPINPAPKVAILLAGNGGSPMIAGTKSFLADVVNLAGGELVGPPVDTFVPASPENLATLNPDIIVLPTSDAHATADANSLFHDPRLQSLTAIKKDNIKALDEDVLLRRGARVDNLIKNLHLAIASKGGS